MCAYVCVRACACVCVCVIALTPRGGLPEVIPVKAALQPLVNRYG